MTTEQNELREAIERLSARRVTRRYPAALRARVAAYARQRITKGASAARVCRELDVGSPTLRKFLKAKPAPAEFVEVRVTEDRALSAAMANDRRSTVTVRGQCGVVVEGLCVDDVARLLRELSCSG